MRTKLRKLFKRWERQAMRKRMADHSNPRYWYRKVGDYSVGQRKIRNVRVSLHDPDFFRFWT